MLRRRFLSATAALLGICVSSVAVGCPPPPPPPPPPPGSTPEQAAAFERDWQAQEDARHQAAELARQQELWRQSSSVFLARLGRVTHFHIPDSYANEPGRRAYLLPVHWLKGHGHRDIFSIADQYMTDCGPAPGWDALAGRAGQVFVVYVRSGYPSQSSIMDAIAPGKITDPVARAAIAASRP